MSIYGDYRWLRYSLPQGIPFPLLLAKEVNKHQLHKMVVLSEVNQEIKEKTKKRMISLLRGI